MTEHLNPTPLRPLQFVYALPRGDGYEMMLSQYSHHQMFFTSLVEYKAHGENARPVLTLTNYIDLLKVVGLCWRVCVVLVPPPLFMCVGGWVGAWGTAACLCCVTGGQWESGPLVVRMLLRRWERGRVLFARLCTHALYTHTHIHTHTDRQTHTRARTHTHTHTPCSRPPVFAGHGACAEPCRVR